MTTANPTHPAASPRVRWRLLLGRALKVSWPVGFLGAVIGAMEGVLVKLISASDADPNLWLAVAASRAVGLGLLGLVFGGLVGLADGLLRRRRAAHHPAPAADPQPANPVRS